MIFDAHAQNVIGNIGWVDKGRLWTFDLKTKTEELISIGQAQYLTIRAGSNGLFRTVHHGSPDQTVSVRRVGEPALELAALRLRGGRRVFEGDQTLWRHVDPSLMIHTPDGTKVLLIDPDEGRVTDIDLSWYTDGNYDLGYQGLVDCIVLPSIERLVVSVQRSSTLIVIDPNRNQQIGAINLCDRGGNPNLQMRTRDEFLASDYDTLCRVDIRTLSVVRSAQLQGAAQGTQQFIGGYDICADLCAVARPFSGDVLLLDSKSFETRGRAQIGGQPLAVSLVSASSVVVRDWKTGKVSIGQFAPQ